MRNIIKVISIVAAIAGCVCTFIGFLPVVIIGAAFNLAEQVMETARGEQTSYGTLVVSAVVGALVALVLKKSIILGLCAGMCFENVIITAIVPIIMFLYSYFHYFGRRR